jgi:hypothetical protein
VHQQYRVASSERRRTDAEVGGHKRKVRTKQLGRSREGQVPPEEQTVEGAKIIIGQPY